MSMTPAQQEVMTQINSIHGLSNQLMAALTLVIPVMTAHGANDTKAAMQAMQSALAPHDAQMNQIATDYAEANGIS